MPKVLQLPELRCSSAASDYLIGEDIDAVFGANVPFRAKQVPLNALSGLRFIAGFGWTLAVFSVNFRKFTEDARRDEEHALRHEMQ